MKKHERVSLFRAVYTVGGKERGMTFAVRRGLFEDEEARKFARETVVPYVRALHSQVKLLRVVPARKP